MAAHARTAESLNPTSAINIRHYSLGDRELAPAIGARKPATAFAWRLRVVDMPCAVPPGDLIRCSGKVAGVKAKEILAHTQFSQPHGHNTRTGDIPLRGAGALPG